MNRKNLLRTFTLLFFAFVGALVFLPIVHAQETTFSFGAAGDYANGTNFKSTVDAVAAANPAFHLVLGDNSYSAGAETGWCGTWKAKYNNVLLITGNHDSGEGGGGNINTYIQHCPFTLSGLQGTYGHQYYFDYPTGNPIARFIMIRPGVKGSGSIPYNAGGVGYTFTQNAIDDARGKNIPWIVVGFHKNYISAMEKPNEIGTDLMKLLLDKKVDLILQGHEHGYERSKQLATSSTCPTLTTNSYNANCVVDSDNTLQKGAGSVIHVLGTGGQGLRGLNTNDSEYPYFASANNTAYGFGKFTLSPASLRYTFVRSAGGALSDMYTITAGNAPPPTTTTPPPITTTTSPASSPTVSTVTSTPSPTPVSCPTLPQATGTVLLSTTLDAGTYKIWTRMQSQGSGANAFYLQIDQDCSMVIGDNDRMSTGAWVWVDYKNGNPSDKIYKDFTAGAHTFKLMAKDPGTRIDKLILTSDQNCVPIDMGDNCAATAPSPTMQLSPARQATGAVQATPVTQASPAPTINNLRSRSTGIYPAIEDASVSKDHPTRNYASEKSLHIDGSPEEMVYMKFDLRALAGKQVTAANLRLTVSNYSKQLQTVYVVSDTGWTEQSLIYAKRPGLGSVVGKLHGGHVGDVLSVNVTGVVNSYAGKTLTLAIKTTRTDALYVYSRESGSRGPSIVISDRATNSTTTTIAPKPKDDGDDD